MAEIESATDVLCRWQKQRLNTIHNRRTDYGMGSDLVTVLAYYWGAHSDKPDTQFYRIESAFRETWLNCGMMKSVIVTDSPSDEMNERRLVASGVPTKFLRVISMRQL